MSTWTQGVRAWTEAFFRCEECRGHFLQELEGAAFKALASKRDAVLWIWETHNRVNERLAGVRAPFCLSTCPMHYLFCPGAAPALLHAGGTAADERVTQRGVMRG